MKAFILLTAVALSGCGFLPKPEVETRFVLQPVTGSPAVSTLEQRVLVVERPQVPMDLRGSQLVLIRDGELTYYSGKAWSAAVPDTLNAALIRDLATMMPNWIITNNSGLRKDYELQTEVHQFATLQDAGTTSVNISADIRLVDPLTRTVLKTLPFRYHEPLQTFSTAETLKAYNKGWNMLIKDTTALISLVQTKPIP